MLEAIRQTVSADTKVTFSADASLVADADAVIVAIGEEPYAEFRGDRKDLSLTAAQIALIEKCRKTGVPVVTVLYSGRPLVLGAALEASDALVAAWLPGTEGRGITDVLFGDYSPIGKLPRTWPRSNEQLAPSAMKANPQFPFGFGLTY